MANEEQGNCPKCKVRLTGVVEITTTTTLGVPSILYRETPDRNWIQCQGCNLIICKACCENYTSGFCNGCRRQLEATGLSKTAASSQIQPSG